MAFRKILTDNDPKLYKVSRPVENFDDRLFMLLDDMAETMYKAEGAGLAACQVGILKRVCVIDCGDGLIELINPVIISTEGEQGGYEGCLSFPGKRGYVVRPQKVVVRAFDRNGELKEYTAADMFARAVMHETDHLDGKVYTRLITEPPEGFDEENGEEDEE
ncbi:MAG: Peptide deformylase 1 [Firmicutes bacterium ADurb.Bin182]|nr:MAG: Peptide deformylase 1 [Firmicutes bacterium ADurb.Bin182]